MTTSLSGRRDQRPKHSASFAASGGLRSEAVGGTQMPRLPFIVGEDGMTGRSVVRRKASVASDVPRDGLFDEMFFRQGRAGRARQLPSPTGDRLGGLLEAALDTFAMPVAVLDEEGRIALINNAWRDFLRAANRRFAAEGVGLDYLDIAVLGSVRRRDALMLRIGLKRMLCGAAASLQCAVCTGSADAEYWYQIRAVRLEVEGLTRIVVTHEDTTAIHKAEKTVEELSRRLLTLQDEERQRIAAELHDSTAQQLTAAALYLGSLRPKLQQDAEARQAIDQVQQTITEAQKEIHTLSYLLSPPYLDRDGLRRTLTRFLEGYARRTGIAATADLAGEIDHFAPEVQLAFLRVVQEALSNVHRHAGASSVRVKMKTTGTQLLFCIADDGKGRRHLRRRGDTAPDSPLNLGIRGMETRINQLGGALKIFSGGSGTSVCGKVPLGRCTA